MPVTDYFAGQSSLDPGLEQMCGGFQLTRIQRFYGFGICFGVGILLSLLSTLVFWVSRPGFAILYTLGNIVSLISTGFLIGFVAQFKKMFDSTRIVASLVFIASMAATLIVAFTTNLVGLVVLCCFIQYAALFWYSISYIPFARDAITRFFTSCIKG